MAFSRNNHGRGGKPYPLSFFLSPPPAATQRFPSVKVARGGKERLEEETPSGRPTAGFAFLPHSSSLFLGRRADGGSWAGGATVVPRGRKGKHDAAALLPLPEEEGEKRVFCCCCLSLPRVGIQEAAIVVAA